MQTLLEISNIVDQQLLEIDKIFAELKRQNRTSEINKLLILIEKKLGSFFKTKIQVQADYIGVSANNVACLPVFKTNKFPTNPSLKDIKYINIIIGYNIIQLCSPSELTSILLHEVGHIEQSLHGFSLWINNLFMKLEKIGTLVSVLPIIGFIFFILRLGGLTLTSRMKEYKADEVAIKYGYGDELMSALHKLNKYGSYGESNIFDKILIYIKELLVDAHPKNTSRIKQINNIIIDKYADEYKSKNIQKLIKTYKL